jgi:hypothetical protein
VWVATEAARKFAVRAGGGRGPEGRRSSVNGVSVDRDIIMPLSKSPAAISADADRVGTRRRAQRSSKRTTSPVSEMT